MVLLEIPNAADRWILAPLSMSFIGILLFEQYIHVFRLAYSCFRTYSLVAVIYFLFYGLPANPAKISSEHKAGKQTKVFCNILLALYIA
jgi:hypothetical protein